MAKPPLIGAPFISGVRRQLNVRKNKRLSQNLSDKDLAVQHGNASWVRVSSGVIVEGNKELAKNNVLQGGILSKLNQGFNQSGNDSSYLKDEALGFRPIPGIDQVNITSQGDQGALNKAEVSFKVNSLSQLDVLEKLYLRPGYHVLIEYGHSIYYDNDENVISNIPSVVDFFSANNVESVNKKIKELRQETDYNYDAALGTVVNFQYSYNNEGGYDCSFYITSKGEVLEGIKATGAGDVNNIKKNSKSIATQVSALDSLIKGKKSEPSSQDSTSEIFTVLNYIYKIAGARDAMLEGMQDQFPQLDFQKADQPYYLHDVSTDAPNRAKKLYISFSTFLKIINNTVNLYIDDSIELVKFGFNSKDKDPINSQFLTYDNHFSSDPHVCLLRKKPADKRLFFGEGDPAFPASSGKGNQIYTDIFLDVSFLISTLNKLTDQPPEDQTVVDYLQKVMEEVERALGGINFFDFYYREQPDDDDTPTVFIVDHNFTSLENSRGVQSNILPSIGKGSLVSNLSITSKIDKDMTSQLSIAAASTDTNISSMLQAVNNSFNKGISDRFAKKIKPATGEDTSTESTEDSKSYKDKFLPTILDAVETFVGGRTFAISDGESLATSHRQVAISDIVKSTNPVPGLMPFEFDVQIQGISGLIIYQGFVLDKGILPQTYDEGVYFMITSVSHNISNNEWTTDISGKLSLLNRDPDKSIKQFQDISVDQKIQDKIDNFVDKSA